MKKALIIKITEVFKSKDNGKIADSFNDITAKVLSECNLENIKEQQK